MNLRCPHACGSAFRPSALRPPPFLPRQHRHEHVLQRRRDGARISTGGDSGGREDLPPRPRLVCVRRIGDHVDAIAEQPDRRRGDCSRNRAAAWRGSAARTSRIDAPHELSSPRRACRRPAACRDGSGPGDCSARPRRDRPWKRRSSPSRAATGRGCARSRGARRDRRRWSARRGRGPAACGSARRPGRVSVSCRRRGCPPGGG